MKTSNSVIPSQRATPVEEFAARSAEAGFDAVELAVPDDGPLRLSSTEAECRRFSDCVRQTGLSVSALVIGHMPASNLISPDSPAHRAASQQIIATMDRARWLGTDAIVLSMHRGRGPIPTGLNASHETAHGLALEALMTLRFEAEQRAVHIVLGNDWNTFLASPFVMRRFIDEINSPWVGATLDITRVLPGGRPEDWLALLGHRVIRVYVGDTGVGPLAGQADDAPGAASVDWSAVRKALRQTRYAAPITYRGSLDPRKARASLEDFLSARDRTTQGEK